MWHSSLADMFDDHLHLRIIGETSILLLEPEMRRVKMHNKRWRTVRVFLKNVGCGFDCNDNERTESVHHTFCGGIAGSLAGFAIPYGSGHLFPARLSFPSELVLVTPRVTRVAGSPGLCDIILARFRGPLVPFITLSTPLVRLGLEPVDMPPGRRVEVAGGEDEGC
jgi:hypothetical protein